MSPDRPHRRGLAAVRVAALLAGLVLGLAPPAATGARAQAPQGEWKHALSLMGEPKYPADFKRFDYVNPARPRAGRPASPGRGRSTTSTSWWRG